MKLPGNNLVYVMKTSFSSETPIKVLVILPKNNRPEEPRKSPGREEEKNKQGKNSMKFNMEGNKITTHISETGAASVRAASRSSLHERSGMFSVTVSSS